ncbi:unnamed protein product [Pleuronectes platessa]|uniref:Uncharacterized protein n=1 Tax=Pleuronectes platessa TaxID=8262 RepID=A0A9N7TLH9_PLEPL|nr:unnamed protein product [Pleuronectes platessa]
MGREEERENVWVYGSGVVDVDDLSLEAHRRFELHPHHKHTTQPPSQVTQERKQGMTQSEERSDDESVTEKTSVRFTSDPSTDLFFIDLSPLENIPHHHCLQIISHKH